MVRLLTGFFILFVPGCIATAQNSDSDRSSSFVSEAAFHAGYIVKNSGEVPGNKTPFLVTINPSVQTRGEQYWHQFYGFPRLGCRFTFGNLGNTKELGRLVGVTPNMTIKTSAGKWYLPSVNLGLGLAWFSKPYDEKLNPRNFYIGSHITALAEASVQFERNLTPKTDLIAGFRVIHCSNSHYQVPNLGLNLISVYAGVVVNTLPKNALKAEKRIIELPEPKIRLNFRSGIGIHELARTLGPAGSPKYKIYVNALYLSRRYGKINNVHAGLEINYYQSFYNFIVDHNFFKSDHHLKSTVFTAFLAHELMISRFSLLTQGGINLYNKFYNSYISMYKSEGGVSLALKKIFSTRLGLQCYLFDPMHHSGTNIFLGAYIKANFGQADFACMQVGVVF